MNRTEYKGSITVFLSLTCILFLVLLCTLIESVRVQGARAQSANITGMGSFSLLGEFEKELLEKYEIFGLDGAYGEGFFQESKVKNRLDDFLSCNANPRKGILAFWTLDPWNLELTDSSIEGYTFLTDDKGEPFFQQVVSYMKTNAVFIAADKLMEYSENLDQIKTWQDVYKDSERDSSKAMALADKQTDQKQKELQKAAEETGALTVIPPEQKRNPLDEIKKLRKMSLLEIVAGDHPISDVKVEIGPFPSRKRLPKGTLKVQKKHGGLLANILFREYLLMYFSDFRKEQESASFQYQLEYILGGKNNDRGNLKAVVTKLLMLREGMNYMYCLETPQISQEAGSLAMTLTGWLGIPAVTTATQHALLLGWAYCESLVDVRILLDGGKVPLFKDAATWSLSLENLSRITDVLKQGGKGKDTGYDYAGYLRILLHMGNLSTQKMRALDLIQCEIRASGYNTKFQIQNCIVAVKCSADWHCRPVFARVASAFLGTGSGDVNFHQESGMSYEWEP